MFGHDLGLAAGDMTFSGGTGDSVGVCVSGFCLAGYRKVAGAGTVGII